ncbi:rhodanese-like domain-containing protein [Sporolactobacillus spathodeae]|uniref:Rhodanese-related sulfurtransferase n=1 Tax=Sporolactobacillus spathodeae TaxID=1465502 RepID=A0ABS2Q5X4_9BACL|nr:rhodanese-like domain-containing protein [Sporolactobacillus spathodeae]MBM7657133.1 rhodanese-related sulfurtransferase [Sporolactobacillus spathodeae]
MGWLIFKSPYKKIRTADLKANYLNNRKGKFFLDVRTSGEFSRQSIPVFTNIPLQSLGGKLAKIPKDKEIVVICQSGMRSSMACKMLVKAGYPNVTNVQGGMNRWY